MNIARTSQHPLALAIAIGLSTLSTTAHAQAQRLVVDDGSAQAAEGSYETTATGDAGRVLWARNPGSRITGSDVVATAAASSVLVADAQGRIELSDSVLRSPLQNGFVALADTGGAIVLTDSRFELTPSTLSATAPSTALGATAGGGVRMTGGSIQSTGSRVARASGSGSVVEMTGVTIDAGADPQLAGSFRADAGGVMTLRDIDFSQPANTASLLRADGAGSFIDVQDSRFSVDGIQIRHWNGTNTGGAVQARNGGAVALGPGTVIESNRAGSGLAGTAQAVALLAVGAGSRIELDGASIDAGGNMVVGAAAVNGGDVRIDGGARIRTNGVSTSSFGLLSQGAGSVVTVGVASVEAGRQGAAAYDGGRVELGPDASITAEAPGARGLVADSGGTLIVDGARIRAIGQTAGEQATGVLVRGGLDGTLAPSSAELRRGTVVETDGVGLLLNAGPAFRNNLGFLVAGQASADGATVTGGYAGAAVVQGSTLDLVDTDVQGGSAYALRIYDDGSRAEVSGGRLALTDADGADAAAIQIRNGTLLLRDGVEVSSSNGVLIRDPGEGLGGPPTEVTVDGVALSGNLVTRQRDSSFVALTNGSALDGAMIGSQLDPGNLFSFSLLQRDADGWNVSVDATSAWQLAGNTDIRSLQLAGNLQFAPSVDDTFKTLVIYGDYTGQDGTIHFNTQLGGDASPTDWMLIGGDTAGTTQVTITNAGGVGAPTTEGIRLIRVLGASDGAFTLSGRAIAGSYDYFLHSGGVSTPADGHWYLRSQIEPTPDPPPEPEPEPEPDPTPDPGPDPGPDPTPDPTPPPPPSPDPGPDPIPGAPTQPTPVYRPEPGIYLANLAATDLFAHRLHERQGEAFGDSAGTRGVWTRLVRNQFIADTGAAQIESRTHTALLQVGADIAKGALAGGEAVFGAMLGTGHAHTRAASNLSGYLARGQLQGHVAGLYATWRDATRASYVDAWVQYGDFRNELQGDYLAAERYDSQAWSISLEAGHAMEFARSGRTSWFVEPQLQVIYGRHDADGHVEANGTTVEFIEGESLTGRAGARVFGRALESVGNRVQPYAGLYWRHSNGDYAVALDGDTVQLHQPDNIYELDLGLQFELGAGWAGWSQFGWQKGDGDHRNVSGLLGLRYRW